MSFSSCWLCSNKSLILEKVSFISEIPTQYDYLVFQPKRNLPPVFQKSQLNLLYELNQKDNFILQNFQTPATLSFFHFWKLQKAKRLFLSPTLDAPPSAISLPHCAAGEGTDHRPDCIVTLPHRSPLSLNLTTSHLPSPVSVCDCLRYFSHYLFYFYF